MTSSICCFLTCIQVSQEAGKAVWYSHLFQNFSQFVVIHTIKGFSIVSEAEVGGFLEFPCLLCDPTDVGSLISSHFSFTESSLYIWKFSVHYCWSLTWRILSYHVKWVQLCGSLNILWHCLSLGLEWKPTFWVLWLLPSFPHLLAYEVQHFHSIVLYVLK